MSEIGMMARAEQTWQDVGAMWEADAAAQWERENEVPDEYYKQKESAYYVHQAWYKLCDVLDEMADAVHEVENTSAEDKVQSLLNDIEDIQDEVMGMFKKLERGEC